jgi:hypothetical protein
VAKRPSRPSVAKQSKHKSRPARPPSRPARPRPPARAGAATGLQTTDEGLETYTLRLLTERDIAGQVGQCNGLPYVGQALELGALLEFSRKQSAMNRSVSQGHDRQVRCQWRRVPVDRRRFKSTRRRSVCLSEGGARMSNTNNPTC